MHFECTISQYKLQFAQFCDVGCRHCTDYLILHTLCPFLAYLILYASFLYQFHILFLEAILIFIILFYRIFNRSFILLFLAILLCI